ncbi:enoyl-CoA hydratase/isomerase family protein [Plastorhodobacter daqingensis]|uniref:3-hydroxyisobutyryl-CoA hydrolase n=1 Tax=Plastorhodobacter daqingensis TaxID=1387281 RepID=A0ABW2UNK2_9RHOB
MDDIRIRIEGRAGRITLTRPQALNALSHPMCLAVEQALDGWRSDPEVALVLIDAEGPRAFCAGGDIADIWRAGQRGDYEHARRFWSDEYRMNLALHRYPKPVVSLMQGFVMGGGVGIGCHGSHRVLGESAQVAMPECGIGLIPDVGGTFLLARAPGALGAYLGLTGARMGPADAILTGFADHHVPEADWPGLVRALVTTGDPATIPAAATAPPEGRLEGLRPVIDRVFSAANLGAILDALAVDGGTFAQGTRAVLAKNSPLSMACTLAMIRALGPEADLAAALAGEYRFTFRAQEKADFQEGIRAAIIDKDRTPHWRHAGAADVAEAEVQELLAPLGDREWTGEQQR